MDLVIGFVLSNFPLICLLLAVFLAVFRRKKRFSQYLLLLPVGLAGIWGFYYHAFYPEMAAKFIGWADSPFQFEVAVANLGMGVSGVIGFWKGREYALAVTLMASCFLWGAAANHVYEIFAKDNFAQGNSGAILFTDVAIPLSLWMGYFCWRR